MSPYSTDDGAVSTRDSQSSVGLDITNTFETIQHLFTHLSNQTHPAHAVWMAGMYAL